METDWPTGCKHAYQFGRAICLNLGSIDNLGKALVLKAI